MALRCCHVRRDCRTITVEAPGGKYDDTLFRVVIMATSSDPKYNRTFVQKRLKVNTDDLVDAPKNVSRTFLNATALVVAWDGGYAEIQWSTSPTFETFESMKSL